MANTKKILIIAGISVVTAGALYGAYAFGQHQARESAAENARNSIVKNLNVKEAETKVTDVVDEIDEAKLLEDSGVKEQEPAPIDPAPKPQSQKPTPQKPVEQKHDKPVMTAVGFSNPTVSVEADKVVFAVNLSAAHPGDCKVFLQKEGDKAGAWHYNKSSSPRSTCVTAIPRSQLSPGVWQYELTFMSDSVYGQGNPKGSVSL